MRTHGLRHAKTRHAGIAARGAKEPVRRYLDGQRMDVIFDHRLLANTTIRALPGAAPVEDDETRDARIDAIVGQISTAPSPSHAPGRPRV